MTRRPTEQYDISWRVMNIIVVYTPDWLSDPGSRFHHSHLEIMSVQPGVPLPITETGYESLSLPAGVVEAAGGAVRYAVQWLDKAANSREWKAIERDQRQGRLF